MKTFTTTCAQGELAFQRLPANIHDIEQPAVREVLRSIAAGKASVDHTPQNHGHLIVGHSETGHHHVLDAEKSKIYTLPIALTRLLVVTETDLLVHLRDNDTHEPIQFTPGNYLVRNLREYVPATAQRQASSRAQYD